ncbi:hypothetical protein KP509_03G043500 [Ceratopteris richardii]|uniref:Protein kinase domain-containing protein n=1 Tax=Ceratopteris richardii TaxID=49495 RepID=A0A8T2V699_CERRI|nr:hypothetical protein KP509_03G043500 [Ceratopteris richardii]
MHIQRTEETTPHLLFALILILLTPAAGLSTEGWALLNFRSNIEDDPTGALSHWSVDDNNPCNWLGVSCTFGNVTSLNLSGLSLRGKLSAQLDQLINLQELLLRGNALTGCIPYQLGRLSKLKVLDLANNQFSGELPEDIGNLSSLSRLYLENNNFEGVIPAGLASLENLCELTVSLNKFTGTIPGDIFTSNADGHLNGSSTLKSGVCKLQNLQVADFSSNYFKGCLPMCLQHLPSVSFSLNCLSGEGLPYQRPVEECTRASYPVLRRHLLETDGKVVDSTVTNTTTDTLEISHGSPSPSPSPLSSFDFSPAPSAPSPSQFPVNKDNTGMLAPEPASFMLPLLPSEDHPSSASKRGAVIAGICLSCLFVFGIAIWLCYRHKSTAVRPWRASMSGELRRGFTKGVPAYSRVELETACEDFSNIIGFSPDIVLFKGILSNGVEIAVTSIRKSAKSWSNNSELIFWQKVECLSQMKHQNLLNLIGFCAEEEPFIRMLVFEYVPNGTVHEQLHNKDSEHLDWETRMRIIMGVAYALEYMHYGSDFPVAHTKLDTKSVYLTEDFTPKLADFGVWKASKMQVNKALYEKSQDLGHEELELSDRLVPQLESNIFDFGVFLLEMVTGKFAPSKEQASIREWASHYIRPTKQEIACTVDPSLESYNTHELNVVAGVAYDCLQPDISRSLTMKEISLSLSSSLSSIKEPIINRSSPLVWAELQILSQD